MDADDELENSNQDVAAELSNAENEFDRLDFHPDEGRMNQF